MTHNVFLSYGHDEHSELARRIAADLRLSGCSVWMDEREIQGGTAWEAKIENAIENADIVVALLTPHAVRRPGGVCRAEIAFARRCKRRIVPVLVRDCQVPLTLCDLHRLDFRQVDPEATPERYRDKLKGLMAAIADPQARADDSPQSWLLDRLSPPDYGAEIDELSRGFRGRVSMLADVLEWLKTTRERVFLVSGRPGAGKSALAAYLCHSRPEAIAYHFCSRETAGKTAAWVNALACQLASELSEYAAILVGQKLDGRDEDIRTRFDRLILQPLHRILSPGERRFIVIDAVDQAAADKGRNDLLDVIAQDLDKAPDWLGFVVTTRSEPPVLRKLSRWRPHFLDEGGENDDDIEGYLRDECARLPLANPYAAAHSLALKCEGLFLYARLVIAELNQRKGPLGPEDLDAFPSGLTSVYTYMFERYCGDDRYFESRQRPLLELLVAAAPVLLPLDLAVWLLRWSPYERNEVTAPLASLFPAHDGSIAPFHGSIVEWLKDPDRSGDRFVDGDEGARRLSAAAPRWKEAPAAAARHYLLRHSLDHLLDIDQVDAALALCRTDDAAFVLAALHAHGPAWVEDQLRRAFELCFSTERPAAALDALLFLWLVRGLSSPVRQLAHLLAGAKRVDVAAMVADLHRISDASLVRTFEILLATRLHASGDPVAAERLLGELRDRHRGTIALGEDRLDCAALRAAMLAGPPGLAPRWVDCELGSHPPADFEILEAAWCRNPSGPLRPRLLAALSGDHATLSEPTVHYLIRQSAVSGDTEVCFAALRAVAAYDHVHVEEFLAGLRELPVELHAESISVLRSAQRLQRSRSIRAAVCVPFLASLEVMSDDVVAHAGRLAHAAEVTLEEVREAFVEQSSVSALDLYEVTPRGLETWLRACVAMLRGMPATKLRRFVSQLSVVARWVAAQSPHGDEDRAANGMVLSLMGGLGDRGGDEAGGGKQSGPSVQSPDSWIADDVFATASWLFERGWGPSPSPSVTASGAQVEEIVVKLLFPEASTAMRASLCAALGSAHTAAPSPVAQEQIHPAWFRFLKEVARSIDVPWDPVWEEEPASRSRETSLPTPLAHRLKKLLEDATRVVFEHGWKPVVCALAYVVQSFTSLEIDDEFLETFLVPAVLRLSPGLVHGYPNHTTWPPVMYPLRCVRVIPDEFAATLAALDVTERGLLWRASETICSRSWSGGQSQICAFANRVRSAVIANPHARVSPTGERESIEACLDCALAPFAILGDQPSRAAFGVLASETNMHADSSCLRLRSVVGAHPTDTLLAWCVESQSKLRTEHTLWLIAPLLRSRAEDLLGNFLESMFTPGTLPEEMKWLASPEPAPALHLPDWRPALKAALGLGADEGIIYQLRALCRARAEERLASDCIAIRVRAQVELATDWQQRIERIVTSSEGKVHHEVVLALLTVAVVIGEQSLAVVAASLRDDPESTEPVLWVGWALMPELVTSARLQAVADAGLGLEILALLGRAEFVAQHLTASAARDPLKVADWYHQCSTFEPGAQDVCLQAYVNNAPALLDRTGTQVSALDRLAIEDLCPVDPISEQLQYAEYALTEPLIAAASAGEIERAQLWMKSILTQAVFGASRARRKACFATLGRCAGALLSVDRAAQRRAAWLDYLSRQAREFETRLIWYSFAEGLILSRGGTLDHNEWIDGLPHGAIIAFAESLTLHGPEATALAFWERRFRPDDPWLLLRAADSFNQRSKRSELARALVGRAWAIGLRGSAEPWITFLGQIVEAAVCTENEAVLEAVATLVSGNSIRVGSVGRIAVQTFLSAQECVFADILRRPGLARLVSGLFEDGAATRADDDAAVRELFHGVGWLQQLVRVASASADAGSLPWIAERIGRVPPTADSDWEVSEAIIDGLTKTATRPNALAHFALAALSSANQAPERQLDLLLRLLGVHPDTALVVTAIDNTLQRFSPSYVTWAHRTAAVAIARHFGDAARSERYLAEIHDDDKRHQARDAIAEATGVSDLERLQRLSKLPRMPWVLKEMATICKRVLADSSPLDAQQRGVLGPLLFALVFHDRWLRCAAVDALTKTLDAEVVTALREDEALIRHALAKR